MSSAIRAIAAIAARVDGTALRRYLLSSGYPVLFPVIATIARIRSAEFPFPRTRKKISMREFLNAMGTARPYTLRLYSIIVSNFISRISLFAGLEWNKSSHGGDTGRRKLDKFEKLIRDAIALLIKQGKISIPRKKPSPTKTKPQKKSK